jgi:purine-binding chemotaxis protein CheW
VSQDGTNVGILVDSVSDIIFAEPGDFREAPTIGNFPGNTKVSGLVQQDDRLIAILDLNVLFSSGPPDPRLADAMGQSSAGH